MTRAAQPSFRILRWPLFSSSYYTPVPNSDGAGQATPNKSSLTLIRQSRRTRFALAVSALACIILVPIFAPKQNIFLDRDYSQDHVNSTHPVIPKEPPLPGDVDWSRFAYSQYATDSAYLCNSLMFFESLHRLGSKADRLLMYPSTMTPEANGTSDGRLLLKAQQQYGAKLVPITVQHRLGGDCKLLPLFSTTYLILTNTVPATWSDSYTKLLAFNQTQYDRVLALDSDSTLLQHMDELFLLPPATVALPRAYWLKSDPPSFTTALALLQPSKTEFARVARAIASAKDGVFDMEIINALYGHDCMVLPHRRYTLLTGEFRNVDRKGHAAYLGNEDEAWDEDAALREAKFLHFSDWPMPKPWLYAQRATVLDVQPKCVRRPGGEEDCHARELWLGFYSDFRTRRRVRRHTRLGEAVANHHLGRVRRMTVLDLVSSQEIPRFN